MHFLHNIKSNIVEYCRKGKAVWEKSKSLLRTTLLILLLSVHWSPLCWAAGSCTQQIEQPTSITMSMTQYNRLKTIIETQEEKLNQLQQKLTILKNNSTTASKELTVSQNQLNELKNELIATQSSLKNARTSLTQAEETLKRQDESLQQLTAQITSLEHKQTVLMRQRDVWATVAAISVGAVISRR